MSLIKKKLAASNKSKKRHPFAAIEKDTIISAKWAELGSTEAHVYNTLKTFYKGNSDFFKAPFSQLQYRSRIKHGTTINKALSTLEKRCWITVKRYAKHGKKRGLRVRPNEYVLTFNFDRKRW